MKQSKQFGVLIVVVAGLMIASVGRADSASQSTTQPATAPAQPSVAAVLGEMDAAYVKLHSAQFDGYIIGHFDVAGQVKNEDVAFTSSFASPNQFRHEIRSEVLLGCDGKTVFSYLNARDEYQNADAPKGRSSSEDWPPSVGHLLQDQNPSLLLAMSKSAAEELSGLSSHISLVAPTVIDGALYDTLRFDTADQQTITLLVDPATHLLRQMKTDLRKSLESAAATDVKTAEVTVDYTRSAPDALVAGDAFAWTAPAGAMLVSATAAVPAGDDGMPDDLKAMIGKDAPDFSLKGLDDKTVKLSDSKGSVVIVDFWATWCGPCVASLPHLNKLYKEQSPNGLKVFAVNLQEDKATVSPFVQKQGWSLPVLLDSDGAVAGQYKAQAIPETVVIGKDGKIKQVFVGSGHEEEIASLIEQELK